MSGGAGIGPLRALDEKSLADGGQRWRFIPLRRRLDSTSARPSALPAIDFDRNLTDVQPDDTLFSHYAATLESGAEVNGTATFSQYVQHVKPLSLSLPLVFRNRKRLLLLTLDALHTSTENGAEATGVIANCLTALSKDLGPEQFHSFFSRVVKEFSSVFDKSKGAQNGEEKSEGKRAVVSVFWDPEVSIVPLFASLAEITKNHLHYLAADPDGTLESLLPLISNAHYRVREMTAESCLGYLLRKTRDANVLKQLTESLLNACCAEARKDALVDGLGAALFEAMRLPSGRLHSRGRDLLSFALENLAETGKEAELSDQVSKEKSERKLEVLSRCFAGLSKYVKDAADVQSVCDTLLIATENAKTQQNAIQAGNVAFLFKRSLQQSGQMMRALDLVRLQRVVNAIFELTPRFKECARVVFESLGALSAVIVNSSASILVHSALKAFSASLAQIASSTCSISLIAAMAATLRLRDCFSSTGEDVGVVQGYGLLCEQLAKLPCNVAESAESPGCSENYKRTLRAALMWVQMGNNHGSRVYCSSGFQVPTLERNLRKRILTNKDSALRLSGSLSQFHKELLYLSSVRLTEVDDIFRHLFGAENFGTEDSGVLLTAFSFQYSGHGGSGSQILMDKARRIVEHILRRELSSLASIIVLRGLHSFVCSFPEETRKLLQGPHNFLQDCVSTLCRNLSSYNHNLRRGSVDLLFALSEAKRNVAERDVEESDDELEDGKLLQTRLKKLRSSLIREDSDLCGFYDTLRFIMEAKKSMVNIESTLRLLQELGRILRDSKNVRPVALKASIHFSIGLLSTPPSVLWSAASEIWGAATCHMQEVGMTVIISHMKVAQDGLLKQWSTSRTQEFTESGDDVGEDVDDDSEPRVSDQLTRTSTADQNEFDTKPCVAESIPKLSSHRRTNKRPRREMRTPKSEEQTKGNMFKRQCAREKGIRLRTWDHSEWKTFCNEEVDRTISSLNDLYGMLNAKNSHGDLSNYLTFLQELLRTLTKEPKHTVRYRSRVISLYFQLDSRSLSRRVGDALVTSFTCLLEKMGGMKCCENDNKLEEMLRGHLLADLTRSCAPLQTTILRCLCCSRYPFLKPYRDSFIRLIAESTFREELAGLTETLLSSWEDQGLASASPEMELIIDVLVRICFSKMIGKRARTDSRRSAALSFIVSILPRAVALPRIVSLVLFPIENLVKQIGESITSDGLFSVEGKAPTLNVQLGVLSSVEAVLKHCRYSLPASSWHQIALGSFVLLQNAGHGGGGQNMRSRALRVLGDMCFIRSKETECLILPIVKAVRKTNFDMSVQGDGRGAPAFLHFVSSVYKTDLRATQIDLANQEPWVLEWGLRFLEMETANVHSVDLSLTIARWLVSVQEMSSDASTRESGQDDAVICEHLLSVLALSLKSLLRRLVDEVMGYRSSHKTWTHVFESALEITEMLTRIESVQRDVLLNLCEGLTSYLINCRSAPTSASKALRALTAIANMFCAEKKGSMDTGFEGNAQSMRNLVLQLLPMFGDRRFIQEPSSYQELCTLIGSLGLQDLVYVSSVLRAANAMDESRLDSPDVDKRIDALNVIVKGFKDVLDSTDGTKISEVKEIQIQACNDQAGAAFCSEQAILALAYGCIAAVRFDDIAVRGTSSYALQLLAKWVAISTSVSAEECRRKVFGLLLESTVSAKTITLRREYCQSFAELLMHCDKLSDDKTCPNTQIFILLRKLTRLQDRESNFFYNLVHMQAHRRGRALRWLENELLGQKAEEAFSEMEECNARASFASRFAYPLGLHTALEMDDVGDKQSNRFSRHNNARSDARKDVIVWAVSLVGASAQLLPWPEYKSVLMNLMRRLKSPALEKESDVLYKLVVKVAEAFPLFKNMENAEYTTRKQFLVDVLFPKMLVHVSGGGYEGDLVDISERGLSGNVTRRRRSPPTMFRAPVAIALGHLLTRLPEADIDTLVSLLVNPLTNALRSRMLTTRDSAKRALTSVLLMLGSKYFSYILRQVLAALREGFRKDACVYVILAILVAVKEHNNASDEDSSKPFIVDGAVELIASYLADELESGTSVIMSNFQDPNASSTRQKQASARAAKALECEEILAELINFEMSAQSVIEPLSRLLNRLSSTKLLSRVENALQKLTVGFSKNKSMTAALALDLCQALISPITRDKIATLDEKQNMSKCGVGTEHNDEMDNTVADYRLIKFGFMILKSIINKNMAALINKSSNCERLKAMLEPFLSLTIEALQTKHDSLKLLALQVAQRLLKVPLKKRKDVAEKASEIIIDVLSQSAGVSTQGDDLFNTCLRAAAILFHEIGGFVLSTVPTERVEALVTIACNCIESGDVDARTAALAVLRAIVAARIVIPAVYDAMEKVNSMAIRAQSSALRSACTSLSIAFMVSFPAGSKRVRQQLEFFVRNLNYEFADGRLAALEALSAMILKFPPEIVESECEYLFVALAACMARDNDRKCRSASSVALQQLFQGVAGSRKVADMLKMASVLLGVESSISGTEEEKVRITKTKDVEVALSGALTFVAACKSGRLTRTQVRFAARALLSGLQVLPDGARWEITYALLQGLESCMSAQGEVNKKKRLEVQACLSELWKMMPRLLLSKHQWIRLSCARLLGKHLSACGGREARRDEMGRHQYSVFWSGDGLVRRLLRSCCLQLEANHLSEELGQQCLKNLLCIGDVVFRNPSIGDVVVEEVSVADAEEEMRVDREDGSENEKRSIRWLLFRMSGMAMKAGEEAHEMLRRGCALRFLLVTTRWWGMEFVRSNVSAYVGPIVRIVKSGRGEARTIAREEEGLGEGAKEEGGEMDGLFELGTKLQEELVEGLGATEFYKVYQEIGKQRENVKEARKRQSRIELAVDPERAAKKRRKRAESKKKKQKGGVGGRVDGMEGGAVAKQRLTADL